MEDKVGKLLQSRRYDPEILPKLEEYVDYQCGNQIYDADANQACLKLYQFYPAKYQGPVVAKILVKAMMALPEDGFLASLYLIPEKFQTGGGSIPALTEMVRLLETGRYLEFWETAKAHRHAVSGVKGFDDAIREFMLSVISRTYFRIDTAILASLLDLTVEDVLAWVQARGVGEVDDDHQKIIRLPRNIEFQSKQKTIRENCSFRTASSVLYNVS